MTKAKTQAEKIVGAEELRWLLAGEGQEPISEKHLSRLVADGMPKRERGRYDALVCMHWYLGKLRPAVQRKATEAEAGAPARNLQDERARLIAAQADAAEMDRDAKQGKLIPLERYEEEVASWAHTTRQLLLGLAARLAPKLEGLPREKLRTALDAALKGCLTDVATARKR